MDEQIAEIDSAQQLMDLCKAQFKDTFNAYFIGIPDALPQGAMPCLIIQKLREKIIAGPTMADDVLASISVTLLVDGKEGFGSTDDDDTVMRKLQNLVEAKDPTTHTYFATSLMGIVRKSITLKNHVLDNEVEINYDVTPRPNQPSIMEASIIITTKERIYVVNRT